MGPRSGARGRGAMVPRQGAIGRGGEDQARGSFLVCVYSVSFVLEKTLQCSRNTAVLPLRPRF